MSTVRLTIRQIKYENKAFWRNPAAVFFTFIFPLVFLVIFNVLFGSDPLELPEGVTHLSTFYVPGIAALSVVSASYTNVAMRISFSRDQLVLKRIKGSPLPSVSFVIARIVHSTGISMLLVLIVVSAGILVYNVDPPTNTIPALIVTLLVGSAAFSALGFAITVIVPNVDAAPAVVNASILPVLFISDVFIPMQNAPSWLTMLALVFPCYHFSAALQAGFNPFETGLGFELGHLLVMGIWLLVGIIVTVRFFSWEPRR